MGHFQKKWFYLHKKGVKIMIIKNKYDLPVRELIVDVRGNERI